MPSLKKFNLQIHGMTCQACEVTVERKFKDVPGVVKVDVNHRTGKAEILSTQMPHIAEFQEAIQDEPYTVTSFGVKSKDAPRTQGISLQPVNHAETGAIALLIFGVYFFLRQAGIPGADFGMAISESMSFGFVFLIGLVAATSTCIAVTGGLLLAVAAKYNERYPELSGLEKFRPHLAFNAGRVISYTLLGGAIGVVGSALTISVQTTGLLTLAASVFMVLMALHMLHVPHLSRLFPRMPKLFGHLLYNSAAKKPNSLAAFFLGAGTFFLPCGFTQALQIYALSTGSFEKGALTMLMFSLGTLPALSALGAMSSFAKGSFARVFVKASAVFVLLLGFANINSGLALTGSNWSFRDISKIFPESSDAVQVPNDPNIAMVNGVQTVRMDVDGFSYTPSHFTVYAGTPVKWLINGKNTYGCTSVLTVPKYGITKLLQQGVENEINFIPTEPGEVRFTCSMGMYGGSFTVVPRPA